MRHGTRLSQDSIYNIHVLAYEISGFVRKIVTFPDLEAVFGMAEVVEGLERELQLSEPGQLLSYDTTFQLGNFYLSILLYKSMIFQEEPCIPALFLMHERKFTSTHATFFSELKKVVPSIQRSRIPIVTDRERAITSAINCVLPEIPNLSCWNHIFQDVRRWLTARGAPQSECTLYIGHLRQLFSQPSLEEYEATLQQLRGVWDGVFNEYYTKHIHPDVDQRVGRWQLESLGVYTYSGVTTNMAESINKVVKALQNWKEAPVDAMLMALYQLQQYHHNEMERGLAGIGEYHLKPKYIHLRKNIRDLELMECPSIPDILHQLQKAEVPLMSPPTTASSLLDPHSSRPTTASSLLDPHSSPPTTASSLLDPHSSPPTTASSLLDPHSSPPTTASSLLDPHSSQPTTASLLLDPHSSQPTTASSLLDPHSSPPTTTSSLLDPHPSRPTTTSPLLNSNGSPLTTASPLSDCNHSPLTTASPSLDPHSSSRTTTSLSLNPDSFPNTISSLLLNPKSSQPTTSTTNVSFDPHLKIFNVKGVSGQVRVVTVFPKATCSCPSTSDCYHIAAVRRAIGIKENDEAKVGILLAPSCITIDFLSSKFNISIPVLINPRLLI